MPIIVVNPIPELPGNVVTIPAEGPWLIIVVTIPIQVLTADKTFEQELMLVLEPVIGSGCIERSLT